MKFEKVCLLACLLLFVRLSACTETVRFTGHGIRILSGRGTPAEPYNKPRAAGRGVGYAVEQRRKHETRFGHLYERQDGSNAGKFVRLHARRLEVNRSHTQNASAVSGLGVNITYYDDPNMPNRGCEGSNEWDRSCSYCQDESACGTGNCLWLTPSDSPPRCEYDQCYSGSCDVSRTCDRETDAECWWQIPCRDCTAPGQVCHGVAACSDPLRMCDTLSEEEKNNMTDVHPCLNPVCESSRTSPGCLDLVYDFCCDPEFEDCNPSADVIQERTATPW